MGFPGVRFAGADLLADALTASVQRFSLGRDVCTVFDFAESRIDLPRGPPGRARMSLMPDLDPEHSERELDAS